MRPWYVAAPASHDQVDHVTIAKGPTAQAVVTIELNTWAKKLKKRATVS
jgi:hypothetical protein